MVIVMVWRGFMVRHLRRCVKVSKRKALRVRKRCMRQSVRSLDRRMVVNAKEGFYTLTCPVHFIISSNDVLTFSRGKTEGWDWAAAVIVRYFRRYYPGLRVTEYRSSTYPCEPLRSGSDDLSGCKYVLSWEK